MFNHYIGTFPEFLISWCLYCISRKHLKMCLHFCIPLIVIHVYEPYFLCQSRLVDETN